MKWKLANLATSALLSAALCGGAHAASDPNPDGISLELSPRVCTLSSDKENCDTVVTARWRAPRDESLCLLIVGQPQVRQCWENHTEGVYTVRLMFDRDLLVQLRDLGLQNVLASETIAVIKEALRLRRKRRQPWDILS
jgi:hypothetical protein